MKTVFAITAAAVLACAPSAAFRSAAVAAPAPAKPAAAWTVDKATSRLRFQSTFGGMPFAGGFQRWGGMIRFDPQNLAGSRVAITVDMASASAGDPERDEALPSDDWFAVKRFPQATFTAASFKAVGGNNYQALGTLTIRGVSRPLLLPFQLTIAGDRAHMVGKARIDRHAYAVGQGQFASAETIPFPVDLSVNLYAVRQK